MSNDDDSDYKVGYRKPPLTHRFKPGESGNPKGAPKKRDNLNYMIERVMLTKQKVTINGETKKMSALEIILISHTKKAMMGDRHSAKFLYDIFRFRSDFAKACPDPTPQENTRNKYTPQRENRIIDVENMSDEELEKEYKKVLRKDGIKL